MSVKAPTCKICGEPHWSTQPHSWDKDVAKHGLRAMATEPVSPRELAKHARETFDKLGVKTAAELPAANVTKTSVVSRKPPMVTKTPVGHENPKGGRPKKNNTISAAERKRRSRAAKKDPPK